MLRDDHVYIQHILDAAHKIIEYTQNRTRQDLDSDELLSLSMVHLLEIIGEAANGVTEDFREEHKHIPGKI